MAARDYARGMLEWSLPALRFRRAGTLALYASWARLSLFGGGLATNLEDDFSKGPALLTSEPLRRELADAGAQVDVRMQLLTQSPLTFSFGWAYAFERHALPTREWMASLKVL